MNLFLSEVNNLSLIGDIDPYKFLTSLLAYYRHLYLN